MATSGIFQLFYNTGTLDEVIYARKKLETNINGIKDALNIEYDKRLKKLMENPDANREMINKFIANRTTFIEPKLEQLKSTHFTFLKYHYKPCVPAVLSYSNLGAVGVQQFGTTIEFRIPNYGQFICDGFFHITIGALATTSSLDRVK